MRKALIIVAVIVVVAGSLGYLGLRQIRRAGRQALGDIQTVRVKRGPIVATVSSAGTVQAASAVSMMFQTSGQVTAIKVREGDLVKAGQELACLDASDLQFQVTNAEAGLVLAQARLAQTQKPASAEDVAAAKAALASAQENLTKVRAGTSATDLEIARLRWEQAKDQLWGAQGQRDATLGSRMATGASEAQAKASVASSEMAAEIARLQYQAAQDPPKVTEILAAQSQVAQAEASLAKLIRGAAPEDIQAAEAQVKQAEVALAQAKRKLADACLTAPFAGTVTHLALVVGQIVGPSGTTPAAAIADLSGLEVAADMSEIDVAQLQASQEVDITLDALPGRTFKGHVSKVAVAGTSTQGVVNFPVTVKLDQADPAVKPGMTANITVIIDRRENVLLVPSRAVHTLNGRRMVTVLRDGKPSEVEVKLGQTGDGMTEVLDDTLKEGDTLLLTTSLQRLMQRREQGGGGGIMFGAP